MAENEFNLGEYLTGGVEKIVKGAVRATLKDPKESAFMARYALASRASSKRRAELEEQGGAHSAVSDCQHYQQLQSALRRLLRKREPYLLR